MKKEATAKAATYELEFVAARTCVEQIIDLCNTQRYFGVPIMGESYIFGDNTSVVNSSTNVHAKLHKIYIALSFCIVCETIVSKYVSFNSILRSEIH